MLQALEPLLAGARIEDDGGLLAREAPVGAEPPGGVGMTADVAALVRDWPDGRIKLLVTACGLRARRAYPSLFIRGEYVGLAAEGPHAEHVVACARVFEDDVLVAIVPRLTSLMSPLSAEPALPLGDIWGQTAVRLPEVWQGRTFRHLATGERVRAVIGAGPGAAVIRLGDALHVLPVALLWSPAARNHNPAA
jgi:(1->4)-alpha-D-glucan 1-alpha-D-glucosylmutase